MILDLTRCFESEGEEIPFRLSVDLAAFGADLPVRAPVPVEGKAVSAAGIVTVSYAARYTVDTVCDRCLDPVRNPRDLVCAHVAVRALAGEEEDDFLVLPDARLDVDEMVYTDVVLDLPSKNLCREDCRGLCPACGANLNRETCACHTQSIDPRLRALRDLLENNAISE